VRHWLRYGVEAVHGARRGLPNSGIDEDSRLCPTPGGHQAGAFATFQHYLYGLLFAQFLRQTLRHNMAHGIVAALRIPHANDDHSGPR
jgi:hypothetical protein